MTDHVHVTTAAQILTLTLARPEKINALTEEMYRALADAVEAAEADDGIRAILIRAEGDMFTAGNDIADFANVGADAAADVDKHVHRFLRALVASSRPVIAAVQGRAVGIGTTLLLHCDIVVLAKDALLSTPFVNLALVPEAASSLLLPARIGHVRAFEMLALGDAVDAPSALAWGLANRCVPRADLDAVALDFATRLARQPRGAVGATKQLMRQPAVLLAQIAAENAEFGARLRSDEAREAFAAFAERRSPDFDRLSR